MTRLLLRLLPTVLVAGATYALWWYLGHRFIAALAQVPV